jgi:5'-3' exonuclease
LTSPSPIRVHLVDGTYELFRQHFGRPPRQDDGGTPVAATLGLASSLLSLLESGATHVGVATDHVVESFRNQMWPGYKTSAGMPPELLAQFPLAEEVLSALGLVVWPMVEFEADDALASAAALAIDDPTVGQVRIRTPDKDLAQCVRADLVVQVDPRRTPGADGSPTGPSPERIIDEEGVRQRYGVSPSSIPDWLALVGDSADGFPGLSGWGPKSASALLARYGHLESIPDDFLTWPSGLRSAKALGETLRADRHLAVLFRQLATLRLDAPVFQSVEELRWRGPTEGNSALWQRLRGGDLESRARQLAQRRS